MAELSRCVVFEWGLWFFGIVILIAFIAFVVIWNLAGQYEKIKNYELEYKGIKIKGPLLLRLAVVLALIMGIGYVVFFRYKDLQMTYAVGFVTASGNTIDLETLRNKYQSETQATIIVRDTAKKFSVAGHYGGTCVVDLFETICRQYADQLSCDSSIPNRSLIINLK